MIHAPAVCCLGWFLHVYCLISLTTTHARSSVAARMMTGGPTVSTMSASLSAQEASSKHVVLITQNIEGHRGGK
jgi:hypothetical protein